MGPRDGREMVVVEVFGDFLAVLVLEHLVVICLAPAAAGRALGDARVHDDVIITRLVISHVVLAAAEHHEVAGVVKVLATVCEGARSMAKAGMRHAW